MARPREPVKLIQAKGKKHLTKKEIEERTEQEIEVPFVDIKIPEYLNKEQKKEFKEISEKLLKIGIFTELDVDNLGRYLQSKGIYLQYTKQLNSLLKNKAKDEVEDAIRIDNINRMQRLQDIAFKQCQSSARDLGLTVTSRCKIVIPPQEDDEDYEL